MLFHILQTHPEIERVVINDINPHLMTAYRTIKGNPLELIGCNKEIVLADSEII